MTFFKPLAQHSPQHRNTSWIQKLIRINRRAVGFNYFNFISKQLRFCHQFGMARDSKNYNTHEPHLPLLQRRTRSQTEVIKVGTHGIISSSFTVFYFKSFNIVCAENKNFYRPMKCCVRLDMQAIIISSENDLGIHSLLCFLVHYLLNSILHINVLDKLQKTLVKVYQYWRFCVSQKNLLQTSQFYSKRNSTLVSVTQFGN